MKQTLVIICLLATINLSFGQGGRFLNGSIIKLDGDTLNVEINYENWVVTPTSISYRMINTSDLTTVQATDIRGFMIKKVGTYTSAEVEIDVSSDILRQLSPTPDPIWETKNLFLQELVSSEASLYKYQSENFKRYFYLIKGLNKPIQLVYKKYKPLSDVVGSNNNFRSQLWDKFQCGGLTQADLKKIDYYENDLIKFFLKYNACTGFAVNKKERQWSKGKLQFGVRAGISNVNGDFRKIDDFNNSSTGDFSASGLRVDTEVEYLTPLNNRRISVFVNLGFESFSANGIWSDQLLFNTTRTATRNMDQAFTIDYSNLAIGIGIRKYIYIKDDLELVIDYMLKPNLDLSTNYEYTFTEIEGFLVREPSLVENEMLYQGIGLGVKYKKGTLNFRYFTERTFLRDNDPLLSDHKAKLSSFSIQLGFLF